MKAARQLEALDAKLARETYLDAISAAIFAGRLALGAGLREVAEAVREAPAPAPPPDAADLLLDGIAGLVTGGYEDGSPVLKRALDAVRAEDLTQTGDHVRWLWVVCHAAMNLWDDDAWDELSRRHVEFARATGALTALPVALNVRVGLRMLAGELHEAESLCEEAAAISEAIGTPAVNYGAVSVAALRGREGEATARIDACNDEVVRRGEGIGLSTSLWARAVLANGLGRYAEALTAAHDAANNPDELTPTKNWALLELIEAAVRTGSEQAGVDALAQLTDTTRASGTDWALGVEARARALLSHGPAAESLYREAIDRLERTHIRVDLDRAHLLYGEWLRRENRRADAREHLRRAHESLSRSGVEAFADRARHELQATGETVRKRSVETRDEFTAEEAQIARLAADGHTNPEIGAQLFISPRTVEWHLRKVFTKLGISSRRELRAALSDAVTA